MEGRIERIETRNCPFRENCISSKEIIRPTTGVIINRHKKLREFLNRIHSIFDKIKFTLKFRNPDGCKFHKRDESR